MTKKSRTNNLLNKYENRWIKDDESCCCYKNKKKQEKEKKAFSVDDVLNYCEWLDFSNKVECFTV